MSDYADLDLLCRDCQAPFVCSAGEQRWMAAHFQAEFKIPSRCKACRDKRKAEKSSQK